MNKSIITVVGKDTIGIIAKVCTIVQEYFNMMMIVDMSAIEKPFEQIVTEMSALGETMGVQIKCQREEIFDKMHRI